MSPYARPPLPAEVFRDASGEPIRYGDRWGSDFPAEDSYSTLRHPERFAALHIVAHALVDHLTATYDVRAERFSTGVPRLNVGAPVVDAVRLWPSGHPKPALSLTFTALPGVIVHLADRKQVMLPFCGCDACDDDVESLVDELELVVLSVAEGRLRKGAGHGQLPRLPVDSSPWPPRAAHRG